MRISDWSSDVCSSDLGVHHLRHVRRPRLCRCGHAPAGRHACAMMRGMILALLRARARGQAESDCAAEAQASKADPPGHPHPLSVRARSEEHTSELQSLMRISYADFCLKTKQKADLAHDSPEYI